MLLWGLPPQLADGSVGGLRLLLRVPEFVERLLDLCILLQRGLKLANLPLGAGHLLDQLHLLALRKDGRHLLEFTVPKIAVQPAQGDAPPRQLAVLQFVHSVRELVHAPVPPVAILFDSLPLRVQLISLLAMNHRLFDECSDLGVEFIPPGNPFAGLLIQFVSATPMSLCLPLFPLPLALALF